MKYSSQNTCPSNVQKIQFLFMAKRPGGHRKHFLPSETEHALYEVSAVILLCKDYDSWYLVI